LTCHLQIDADPDPAYQFDADPDPDPTFQIDADPCGSGSATLVQVSGVCRKQNDLLMKVGVLCNGKKLKS
jgi:hypothetical protein